MSEHTGTRIRASDEERERVAAVVRTAMSEGRLSLAEGEQRMAELYASTYRDELDQFTADLPVDPPERTRDDRPGADGRRHPGPARGLPLVAVAAGIALVWALLSGSLLGPAILLGVATMMVFKHGNRRRWHRACAR